MGFGEMGQWSDTENGYEQASYDEEDLSKYNIPSLALWLRRSF
jgi:hypothetical protein